jgi:two-component system CheB/CheR fusion protein
MEERVACVAQGGPEALEVTESDGDLLNSLRRRVSEAELARSEAERANRAKDLFLAMLGHELRAPLTSLLLQAQMLSRGRVMDAAKLARVGAAIERGTRMQVQLIDDLLDASRIASGQLEMALEAVDLRAAVKAALEGVSLAARRKSIRLEVILDESVGAVAGDMTRLEQVVSNVLTNAIKFTPDRGQVSITVDAQDGHACIKVTDTGVGIAPEVLPNIFERFSRPDDSNTRGQGGLGLGLFIVRHLVERHAGTIHAESAGPGRGASFIVRLPLMKAQRESPDAPR